MNTLIVTLDLDWACEPAIEDTLDFLNRQNIRPTIFATHRSQRVESAMKEIEVGLHPFSIPILLMALQFPRLSTMCWTSLTTCGLFDATDLPAAIHPDKRWLRPAC